MSGAPLAGGIPTPRGQDPHGFLAASFFRPGDAVLVFLLLGLPGCHADPSGLADLPAVAPGPPGIVEVSVACDSVAAEWAFEADTNAWSGNGEVLLSTDGRYLERHRLPSTEAARDGTSDHLEVSLAIVGDWRDVALGSTTVFNCQEPGLAGLLYVYETDGETLGDCRRFGEDRWAGWASEEGCETTVEVTED